MGRFYDLRICRVEQASLLCFTTSLDSSWSWLVLAVCMLGTTLMGSSYVLFSLIYQDLIEEFETTSTVVGWVGSIYAGSANLIGIPAGLAVDRYGCRVVCIFGSIVCALGMFLSFFATRVTILYFTYGLLSGTGLGLMVTTCNINSMRYFEKNRALAGGIVSVGYSVGAIFIGPLSRYLFQLYTWRGVIVLVAGFTLQMTVAAAFAFKPLPLKPLHRPENHCEHSIFNKNTSVANEFRKESFREILSDPQVVCFLLSCCFMYTGAQSHIHHNPRRAILLGVQRQRVAYVPISFDVASATTKVICGVVSNFMNRTSRITLYSTAVVAVGLCHMATFLFNDFLLILLHGALTGFFTGFTFSLYITIMVDLKGSVNITKTQPATSFCFGVVGLMSTPFTGFIYEVSRSYNVTFLTTGCLMVFGGLWGYGAAAALSRRNSKLQGNLEDSYRAIKEINDAAYRTQDRGRKWTKTKVVQLNNLSFVNRNKDVTTPMLRTNRLR
ncbi:hypothetical protein HELRODRAFT_180058 [Helobdella robusta]|uniref:Major facilitator superfamily (MFS) profile domain-containing protein n=1 Tax=Helobdella robusta TaxID=6412 RepID=T1FFF0_HELRO|nr:hypothetical protein HELRODRAFT_180058 [Helobdella robusta]ESN94729.1 hypothetical protein HELRODRAFT_180058 [Helobdella robusta]